MTKVHILVPCDHCNRQAFLPIGETVDNNDKPYVRHIPCPNCAGSGTQAKWVSLPEFVALLEETQCQHEHTVMNGGFHFTAGDVWDDISEVCTDCGATLD